MRVPFASSATHKLNGSASVLFGNGNTEAELLCAAQLCFACCWEVLILGWLMWRTSHRDGNLGKLPADINNSRLLSRTAR